MKVIPCASDFLCFVHYALIYASLLSQAFNFKITTVTITSIRVSSPKASSFLGVTKPEISVNSGVVYLNLCRLRLCALLFSNVLRKNSALCHL